MSRGDKAKERGIKKSLGVKRINEIGRVKKEKDFDTQQTIRGPELL